ncbi:unnamed protein product, partial [Prorocentrum cordatum]
MSFSESEITRVIGFLPPGAFDRAETQAVRAWVAFVLGVDPKAKEKHPVFHYISMARLLAETVGTAVVFASKAQVKCKGQVSGCGPGGSQGSDPGLSNVAGAPEDFAEAQAAALKKGQPKGLTVNLKDRVNEL